MQFSCKSKTDLKNTVYLKKLFKILKKKTKKEGGRERVKQRVKIISFLSRLHSGNLFKEKTPEGIV